MANAPAFGYPIQQFGQRIYQAMYRQSPPSISGVRWYRWFAGLSSSTQFQTWARAQAADSADKFLANMLVAHGAMLADKAAAEELNPTPATDVPYNPLVTTSDGFSLWSGQYQIPLADSAWFQILAEHFGWARIQIQRGNLSVRAMDVIVQEMVLPGPTGRKMPLFSPPASLANDEVAIQGWLLWKRETGGNEAMARYSRASMQQWQDQHEQFQRLDAFLGGAERVLRYTSLQEPVLRLQEKLAEFFTKRRAINDAAQVINENREVAARVLTPAELQQVEAALRAARQAEIDLHAKLPSALWQGGVPVQLSGLGAITVATTIIAGTVAVGLIAVVVWGIKALDTALTNIRQLNALGKINNELTAMRVAAERARQECRLSVEQNITNPTQKAQMLAQCDTEAQRTLQEIAEAQARNSAAIENVDQPPQDPAEKENSGLYLGIGLALVAGWAWLKGKKR